MAAETTRRLRSARWFEPDDFRSFGHRSRMAQMGYGAADYAGKPVIAVVNTWSDANQCHAHFKQRVEDVKRGVLQAGGFPLELPAMSLSEPIVKPTTMLYRNFLAMETEELLRSHPVDGAVLMGGCDKTIPGLVMGALSTNLPFIVLPAGPMLRGNWRGRVLGSGSDGVKYWDERRAGRLSDEALLEIETGIARSQGTCMTMGTAATMMGIAEAVGLTLPGASSIPAADAGHIRMSAECGRRIVQMVRDDLTPARLLTRDSFTNGIACAMAMGCSTNAIIHLIAISRRAGHPVTLDDFDAASRTVPVIANVRPSGDRYLMEDFFYAGGLPAMLDRIRADLATHALTVNGRTLGENVDGAEVFDDDVIRPLDNPIYAEGALAVLRGNLAPDGVVIKPSACAPHLLRHTGRALVYDDYASLAAAVGDPDLDVTADDILVLRYAGPCAAGMPEWGMLPIPTKLLRQGITDMLRLSDARMSGTSYGGCLLHCAPEAHVGGPLALVETGDRITVDVPARRIHLEVTDAELARRHAAWTQSPPVYQRGYGWIFQRHILQADSGCDFDFLETSFGDPVPEPLIH
ncbi:MAG: dihydroxy-acid dehydratase [Actinobacteria bacterium]|nr:dihydroxy-acid dehydratase [Actinomycetota bacterium]